MTKFSLAIDGHWLGEFDPPVPFGYGGWKFSYRYYCIRCGEPFATRLGEEGACWNMLPSVCLMCAPDKPVLDWCSFRLPCEQSWEPLPILAMEFLYNYEYFFKEIADERSSPAP